MTDRPDNRAAFNTAYTSLNKAQKKAVDTIEGPVMVIAGPGTGKTQILTLRIANILIETDTAPESILALTFTNSGVRAMRERLRTYIKDDAYRVGIYTFHSFAEHILQQYSSYFPAREFATVISEIEKAKLLEEILTKHDFSELVSKYDRFSSLRQVMSAIGDIKQEGYQPSEFEALIPVWEQNQLEDESMFYKRATGKFKAGDVKPAEEEKVRKRVAKARELATVFSAYQQALLKQNRYDFSDMILAVLKELEGNENLKLDLQERYQYVLVDEHQDTNDGQNKLIEHLTDAEHLSGRPNLFTVGDEKQSIYRFQGASDKAFAHFKHQYQDVEVIELENNYRSGESILTASHALITHSLPQAVPLSSNQSETKPVTVLEFSDYKFELLYVAKDILAQLEAGVPADEIAVIYRSNKHLTEIKTIFHQLEIPYQVLSRDTLLDDPDIQKLVTCIKVVANPYDDHSLGKLLLADFLALDPIKVTDTLRSYRTLRRDGAASGLIEVLREDAYYASVVELLATLQTYEANHHFAETFKEVLQVSGFLSYILKKPDSRSALRKVEVLFNEFRQQAERSDSYQAADFVAFVEAAIQYSLNLEVTAARVGKGVQCMTAHGSKGLEFAHVYLINTARSNWEKSRGFPAIALPILKYVGELDDERRLFYVAITRAKQHLTVSSSRQDWSGKALEPSQFISELGEEAVAKESTEAFEEANESELVRFFSNEKAEDSIFEPVYLRDRFLEQNLSVTALNNYLDCPLKYLFRNLIQLPDVYTPALRYGDAMHRSLEVFFRASAKAETILPRENLLQEFEKAMQTSGFFGTEYDEFLAQGRRSLGMYYDYYQADWSTTVEVEAYIRRTIELSDITITLSGKIDKLEYLGTYGSGNVRVVDYKTGKVFSEKSTKAQKLALERQIQFYHLLLAGYRNGDVTVTEAVLDFIEPTKENEFEQKSLSVTVDDLNKLQTTIEEMVHDVVSGTFLEKGCDKKDCEACAFWATLS